MLSWDIDISQLSQLIVNAGGVAAVVDYVGETQGNIRLPGIMMLGYVAAHSENLAMAVIVSKVSLGWESGKWPLLLIYPVLIWLCLRQRSDHLTYACLENYGD